MLICRTIAVWWFIVFVFHQSRPIDRHAGGLVIGPFAYFNSYIDQLAALTARLAMPAIFQSREFVAAGGLIGYGPNFAEVYRLVGNYAGKILNGEKPADLPVMQVTTMELFINLKTAKALSLTVPLSLLGRADEVIEYSFAVRQLTTVK